MEELSFAKTSRQITSTCMSLPSKFYHYHLIINYIIASLFLGVRRDSLGPRNRGTRAEALSLLGEFCCVDSDVFISPYIFSDDFFDSGEKFVFNFCPSLFRYFTRFESIF